MSNHLAISGLKKEHHESSYPHLHMSDSEHMHGQKLTCNLNPGNDVVARLSTKNQAWCYILRRRANLSNVLLSYFVIYKKWWLLKTKRAECGRRCSFLLHARLASASCCK
ncbi:hypothetical protein Naga_100006g23 [Nannochloropsis gaditana]|uniref:Uncharacterized protein n=1 Tax=Nannochloropsis gaditana TaxID=72520 RepID=W7TQX2_9STRA|nr:hypothetical protein Naga_100006g23 [Nannochloropsis gaditana]